MSLKTLFLAPPPRLAQRAQVQSGQGGSDGGCTWTQQRSAPHLDTATLANGRNQGGASHWPCSLGRPARHPATAGLWKEQSTLLTAIVIHPGYKLAFPAQKLLLPPLKFRLKKMPYLVYGNQYNITPDQGTHHSQQKKDGNVLRGVEIHSSQQVPHHPEEPSVTARRTAH